MPERGVWLAGEHTAPFVALGTVTGAWWSGEGVGRRIVAAYGDDNLGGEEEDVEVEVKGKDFGSEEKLDGGQLNGIAL